MHLVCNCIQYGELVRKDRSRPDEASFDQKSSIQGLLNIAFHLADTRPRRSWQQQTRNVQKSSSSKAAALLTRGAYAQYVSTAKWRLACAKPLRQAWNCEPVSRSLGEGSRVFSTCPFKKSIYARSWAFLVCYDYAAIATTFVCSYPSTLQPRPQTIRRSVRTQFP